MNLALAAATVSISIAIGFGQPESDSVEQYLKDLEANPKTPLAHHPVVYS